MALTTTDFALSLLDDVLGARDPEEVSREQDARRLVSLGFLAPENGQTIQTRGCSKCGATMYRTVETDSSGNPTGSAMFICSSCGNMEA
ncbi:hypothetical protein [Streptomyces sp. NPDC006477]|uniref:hypothetical protein n=1 Tax=Streptomyces sp. NPDC006477 TaxID=3364747 RepID=UPI0036ABC238